VDALLILAFLKTTIWTIYAIQITIFSIISFGYKSINKPVKAKNVEFIVVSIASSSVKNSLYEVIEHLKSFDRKINILTDEGAELITNLKQDFPHCSFVIVPKSFQCSAVAKGRAIEYFIRNIVNVHTWYAILDDDSYPLDDRFLYEISHREQLGYVAANGLLYPRTGKNVYTYLLDHFRYLDDVTFFRVCQGTLHTPLCGFHGELLIIKGSTLLEVGFNRKSITEDFSFGIQIVKKKYKTWSSQTKVSIKSPNNFTDLIKQRARWYKGILLDLKAAPYKVKFVMGVHLFRSTFSFAGSFLFMIFWIVLALIGYSYIIFNPLFIAGTIY
jgi:egghead protein (zeste-white 4 protein)